VGQGTAKYPQNKQSPYLMHKLSSLLNQEHEEPPINILKQYSIQPQELNLHIKCPRCMKADVQRGYGTWNCQTCGTHSPNAHEQSIKDYLLLFGSITNQQARQILDITSIALARRLLEKLNLTTQGSGKAKNYFLHHC
jgi:hypothetical protein